MKRFKYLSEHISFLSENYKTMNLRDLTKAFNTNFCVKQTEKAIKSTLDAYKIRCGRTGNKRLLKQRPIGSEQICPTHGYVWIKTEKENPRNGSSTQWKQKHIVIWEKENGPVPKGMVISFLDGDKANCEPENLMLLTRSEVCRLYQNQYNTMPCELKPSVLALSKLQAAIGKKQSAKS